MAVIRGDTEWRASPSPSDDLRMTTAANDATNADRADDPPGSGAELPAAGGAPRRAARASGNPVGRPVGRSSETTRMLILDSAETLFAERGFDGVSVRDVGHACNVQSAAVAYHFGTKLALFEEVVARRASVVNAERQRLLDEALAAQAGGPIPIEQLVRRYMEPLVRATDHGDPGWRNFAILMGRLANSPMGTEVIQRHFSDVASLYLAQFRRALPRVPSARIVDAFLYMVSTMVFVCADTGRRHSMLAQASTGRGAAAPETGPRKAAAVLKDLVPFVTGGIRAMCGPPPD
jgi:AcrR family transcriptional regulator